MRKKKKRERIVFMHEANEVWNLFIEQFEYIIQVNIQCVVSWIVY